VSTTCKCGWEGRELISIATDCGTAVENFPVCANSTWIMFVGPESGYFCCEQGQTGVDPTTGRDGLCEPAGQVVPTNLLAKTV